MKKRITDYRKKIDKMLMEGTQTEWGEVKKEHLVQLSFFQNERLIHLIVTVTFALLEMITIAMVLLSDNMFVVILSLFLLILLIPYIRHYYHLENEVQKLYVQYDSITEKQKEQDRGK